MRKKAKKPSRKPKKHKVSSKLRNILTPKTCKFCKKIKKKDDVVFENDHIVAMWGRQHHKGHLMVMPRIHEEHLLRLHPNTIDSFMNDTILICRALDKAIKFDRINLEYLDNWDFHIHWNVYARFKSDPDFGNPPEIPKKGQKFKDRSLTAKELKIFLKEIDKIKDQL